VRLTGNQGGVRNVRTGNQTGHITVVKLEDV